MILLSLLRSLRRKVKQYRLLYVQVTADQQLSKKNTLIFLYFFSPWSLLCTLILTTKPNKALNENEEIITPTLNLEVVYISINHLDVSLTIVNLAHWLAKKKKPSVVTNAKATSHHLSPRSWGEEGWGEGVGGWGDRDPPIKLCNILLFPLISSQLRQAPSILCWRRLIFSSILLVNHAIPPKNPLPPPPPSSDTF